MQRGRACASIVPSRRCRSKTRSLLSALFDVRPPRPSASRCTNRTPVAAAVNRCWLVGSTFFLSVSSQRLSLAWEPGARQGGRLARGAWTISGRNAVVSVRGLGRRMALSSHDARLQYFIISGQRDPSERCSCGYANTTLCVTAQLAVPNTAHSAAPVSQG